MIGQFIYGHLSSYPHLREKEVEVWEKFIRLNPDFFDTVDYDCVCGSNPIKEVGLNAATTRDAMYLGRWKIDVVGYKNGITYVVEVRPRAELGAISQAIDKAILYQREHPDQGEIEPIIITDEERPDMRALTAEHDVGYIVV